MTIEEICKKFIIKNYTINPDGLIDVDGDVYLSYSNLTKLPLRFNIVTGSFYCIGNKLTSLVGCPKEVGGGFYCSNNELTSLEGCPSQVGGHFHCSENYITDLTGLNKFTGNFYCGDNPIRSIFNKVEQDFTYAFQVYQVINGNEINLKRLKYVMNVFDLPIDLEKIKEYYKLV